MVFLLEKKKRKRRAQSRIRRFANEFAPERISCLCVYCIIYWPPPQNVYLVLEFPCECMHGTDSLFDSIRFVLPGTEDRDHRSSHRDRSDQSYSIYSPCVEALSPIDHPSSSCLEKNHRMKLSLHSHSKGVRSISNANVDRRRSAISEGRAAGFCR